MSDFLDILDNHRDLLQERGYDEIGLGSPDEPGLFMRKLEYLFSECIRKSEYNNEKQDLFIEAYGFFDNDNDIIRLKFHYEFNPVEKDIELKSLTAGMDDEVKVFLFSRNSYALPHASKVHRMLSAARRLQTTDLAHSQPNIEKIVEEQVEFFTRFRGDDNSFYFLSSNIYEELRLVLNEMTAYPPTQNQNICIEEYIHFGHHEFFKCSFNYEYNSEKSDLQLKGITARKDAIEHHFSIGDQSRSTITASKIHKGIKDSERIAHAKEIAMHIPAKSRRQKL